MFRMGEHKNACVDVSVGHTVPKRSPLRTALPSPGDGVVCVPASWCETTQDETNAQHVNRE